MLKKIKNFIKKNKLLYIILKPCINILMRWFAFIFKKKSILRNASLLKIYESSNNYKNIFILDTRIHSIVFDSFVFLVRGSNFYYNDKWTIIIYEDEYYRYSEHKITKEIYRNSLINIFLQSLLILPNPPTAIKFVNNSHELLKIIKKSNRIFPEDYNFFIAKKPYLVKNFNQKDFENFQINQPILKSIKFYSDIFENYLKYRNISNYITITVRCKSWGNNHWNTDIDDIAIFLNFIKKNNLNNYDILIIPDTQQDVPKEIIDVLKNENLRFHLFHHGSFSIPMRFLAYSKASFNFASTNGPATILFFIDSNSFFLKKDKKQEEDVQKFINKFNKKIFPDRRFIFNKKNSDILK